MLRTVTTAQHIDHRYYRVLGNKGEGGTGDTQIKCDSGSSDSRQGVLREMRKYVRVLRKKPEPVESVEFSTAVMYGALPHPRP